MEYTTGYCLGEPEIGEEIKPIFRDQTSLKDFLFGLPERNIVDLYQVCGEIVKDDGTPDGLVMLVLNYQEFKLMEN